MLCSVFCYGGLLKPKIFVVSLSGGKDNEKKNKMIKAQIVYMILFLCFLYSFVPFFVPIFSKSIDKIKKWCYNITA